MCSCKDRRGRETNEGKRQTGVRGEEMCVNDGFLYCLGGKISHNGTTSWIGASRKLGGDETRRTRPWQHENW